MKKKHSRYSRGYYKKRKHLNGVFTIPLAYERAGVDKVVLAETAKKLGYTRNEVMAAAFLFAVENPEVIQKTITHVKRNYGEVGS